jgi:ATP-dependent exoDNAse (exonuclease V) beta subunit
MANVSDHLLRENALDPTQSFIVQAPAGSGKTELLTQRLLVLLATTQQDPEEIVAITFTRKAASEMRSRVYEALLKAQQPAPAASHELKTWQLANNVLAKDKQHHWQLLQNPNRLRIFTIDALCAKIAKSAPVLSRFGTIPAITADSEELYREAASKLLESLNENSPWQSHLTNLLLHLDNNFKVVQDLFVGMLHRRDQWLPYLMSHKNNEQSRESLEQGLRNIILESLAQAANSFPQEYLEELKLLSNFAANNLAATDPDSIICVLHGLTSFSSNTCSDRKVWLALQEFFLTQAGEWRKTVNKNNGFPVAIENKNSSDAQYYKQMKERMIKFLGALNDKELFRLALQQIAILPPEQYSENQWQVLAALTELLPVLVAYLHTIFQERNVIDFIAVARGALDALGEEDNPTDLALNLDYRIRHLLVDEFQDTSVSQFNLLQRLTAGWENSDGRTLFLVGDPMQSIYRFREAEVGLFLQVKHQGMGAIKLQPITLEVNFRSQAGIVKWFNNTFATIFPAYENKELGAIPYSSSVAFSDIDHHQHVVVSPLCNATQQQEAEHIVKLIQQEQALAPHISIAVLVRSRSHLQQIVPTLKRAQINFQAIEIERLIYSPVVSDLFALTKALCHLADRIAWLAVLRAPWCGLTLSDLYAVANYNVHGTIWANLQNYTKIENLSHDGQHRLSRIVPILAQALNHKLRTNFRSWLAQTWYRIGGPACLSEEFEINNSNAYFDLLDELQSLGEININLLQEKLYNSYIHSSSSQANVHVLTIHKAKGLEYDLVIMPSLESKPAIDDQQLLLWWERINISGHKDLILAPIKSLEQRYDYIYRYLKTQETAKTKYEIVRLLYVAATRARQKLYLIGNVIKSQDSEKVRTPISTSFLGILWPVLEKYFQQPVYFDEPVILSENDTILLERLTSDWQPPLKFTTTVDLPKPNFYHFEWQPQFKRQIGIIIHQYLQKLSAVDFKNLKPNRSLWSRQLAELGVVTPFLEPCIDQVEKAITNIHHDQTAKWILDPTHEYTESEYPICVALADGIFNGIIDRTFIDQHGTRWIIDYKTSENCEGELTEFYTSSQQCYAEQLEKYAQYFRMIEDRPIKLGLYFPMFCGWHTWNH